MRMGLGIGLTPQRAGAGGGAPATPVDMTAVIAPATVATQYVRRSGDTAWTTPDNALVDDATAAVVAIPSNGRSQFLPITFAAASIPTDALVTGVTISLRINSDGGGANLDNLYLTDATGNIPTGMPIYNGTVLTTGTVTYNYGGATEKFGLPLRPAAFNSGLVGMAIGIKRAAGTGNRTISLQYATMTVHYTTTLGSSASPKIATATVMMRNGTNWDGNASKLSRVFFPGMGMPVAVMYWTAGITRADWGSSTPRTFAWAGIFSHVGFSVPGKQAGSIRSNNNGVTAFDASGISNHTEQAIPNNQPGHGNQSYNYTISARGTQVLRANIDTFGTDYVDAIASSAFGNEDLVLHVVGFFGVSAHLYQEEGFGSVEGPRVIAAGFNPDLLLTNSHDQPNTAAHAAYGMLGMGASKRNGSTWTSASSLQVFATRQTTGGNSGPMADSMNILHLRTDALSNQINTNDPSSIPEIFELYPISVTASDASGYTLDVTPGGDRNFNESGDTILAIGGLGNTFVGFVDTPTATGDWTPNVGFKPDLVLAYGTIGTAIERTQDVSDLADAATWFVAGSSGEAFSIGHHLPNQSAPGAGLNAAQFINRGAFQVKSGTFASPVDRVVGSFTRMAATGPTLNMTTVDATPRKVMIIAAV